MAMTVVVTRDVEGRYRGFLGSCMLELAPGVYTAPRMTRGIRERVWRVIEAWHGELGWVDGYTYAIVADEWRSEATGV